MTTRAENNPFPFATFVETVDPPNADSGTQRLFVDTDHLLKLRDASGTVTTFGAGLSDPMTTRGDVIVRNASNVTARLAKGSAGTYLGSDGTDVAYAAVTDAQLSTSDITTNNASTSKHGFLKKLSNSATDYMDGTGAWSTPAGGGSGFPTTVNAPSTADTSIATASGYVDITGCSMSLAAGTWIAFFQANVADSVGSVGLVTFRFLAGSTDIGPALDVGISPASFQGGGSGFTAPFVLGSTTTVKLQGASTATTMNVRTKTQLNNSNNDVGTLVWAMRLA